MVVMMMVMVVVMIVIAYMLMIIMLMVMTVMVFQPAHPRVDQPRSYSQYRHATDHAQDRI